MKSVWFLLALAFGASAVSPAVLLADQGNVQNEMRQAIGDRNVLKPKEIEARVLPKMRGMQYLGPEYDPAAMAYRLKFIRDGRVVFIDVDARSGRVIDERR